MNCIGHCLTARSPLADEYSSEEGLERLLQAVGKQDTVAFKSLRQATTAMMFAVAYRILRNHADVEDVVGGVFIKVWFQANRFNPARGSARAWLATMCRNASIDWIRRGATRSHRELSDSELELEFDSTHSPELQIEKSQLGLAVSHALSRLPRLQRQVVELAFYRGLSHSEISLAAKLPLGTVKSHLRRSLIQLHRDLDTGNSRRNQHGPAALKLM